MTSNHSRGSFDLPTAVTCCLAIGIFLLLWTGLRALNLTSDAAVSEIRPVGDGGWIFTGMGVVPNGARIDFGNGNAVYAMVIDSGQTDFRITDAFTKMPANSSVGLCQIVSDGGCLCLP